MTASAETQARRRDRVDAALKLREAGLSTPEIADRMGLARETVIGYLRDPDGKKGRAYRAALSGVCETCGAATSKPAITTCTECARAKLTGPPRLWTREGVVATIQAWVVTYGAPPRMSDWGGAHATPEQRARYRRLRAGRTHNATAGRVPCAQTAITLFGSWSAAITAAGYTPLPPTGSPGRLKEACKQGHPFTPENTYHYPDGHRGCRVCRRRFSRNHKQKNPPPKLTPEQRSENARNAALARWARSPRPSAESLDRPASRSARS